MKRELTRGEQEVIVQYLDSMIADMYGNYLSVEVRSILAKVRDDVPVPRERATCDVLGRPYPHPSDPEYKAIYEHGERVKREWYERLSKERSAPRKDAKASSDSATASAAHHG